MSEFKTILISLFSCIGGMFLGKIFSDTFKNTDLNVKTIYRHLKRITQTVVIFLFLKLLYLIKPEKANALMLVMLAVPVIAMYFAQKKIREVQAQRRWDSC